MALKPLKPSKIKRRERQQLPMQLPPQRRSSLLPAYQLPEPPPYKPLG